jgi:hypothetical protein
MSRRPSPFPRYVHAYRDRHGTLRTDFRRAGRSVALPPPPLSEQWWEAYRAALAGDFATRDAQRAIGAERTRPGTVGALYVVYVGSAAFKNGFAESTQAVHRNILSRWRDQWGHRRLRDLQPRHVVGWLDERADTPAAAQVFLKILRRAMRYGVSIGLLETDPTAGIKAPALKSTGIYTWTDEEIAQYRHHKPGTNARLALELLIGTAQRKSDVVRMGRQHVRGGSGRQPDLPDHIVGQALHRGRVRQPFPRVVQRGRAARPLHLARAAQSGLSPARRLHPARDRRDLWANHPRRGAALHPSRRPGGTCPRRGQKANKNWRTRRSVRQNRGISH